MADNSFTFWANMKEAIDVYDDPVFKYQLYDALTELALYGTWPEDDGNPETKIIILFLQAMVPSIEKSRNYSQGKSTAGVVGGRRQKVSDEQLRQGIEDAALKKKGIPTRAEVVQAIYKRTGIKIDAKTVSRRCPDEQKEIIAQNALQGQNI